MGLHKFSEGNNDGQIRAVIFDLDDTLISEYEFVVSGYRFVSEKLAGRLDKTASEIEDRLWELSKETYSRAFNRLFDSYGVSCSEEELKELIWADGALELVFIIKAGKDNCDSKPFTVSFSQAFQIDKYELVNKYNWLGAKKSIYAKIDDSYLVPKWIFVNIPLFTWDVRTCPSKYKIVVIEKDSGISKTVTETEEVEYMNNTTSDASGTFNDYVKIGYNSGNKETVKKKITYSYQMTQSCDSLGSVDVEYKRAIITDYPSASLAHVAEARSGGVDIQIIPLRK